MDCWKAENGVISCLSLEELLSQNIKKLLDKCEMVHNKTLNPHCHSSLHKSSNKLVRHVIKSANSSESSMSDTSKKRNNFVRNDHNMQSNNSKRCKHHQNYYQIESSPSSSLTSHNADCSNRCMPYQNEINRIFGQSPLKLSPYSLFLKILIQLTS